VCMIEQVCMTRCTSTSNSTSTNNAIASRPAAATTCPAFQLQRPLSTQPALPSRAYDGCLEIQGASSKVKPRGSRSFKLAVLKGTAEPRKRRQMATSRLRYIPCALSDQMSEQLCTRPVPRRCVSRVSLLCVCVCVCVRVFMYMFVRWLDGDVYRHALHTCTCALTFSQSRLSLLLSYPLCFSSGHWHIKSSSNGSL